MVKVKIEQFEGPLDLLLHLIHENKYDIFDIPILEITDQYMAALQAMQEFDMEVATEFLVMAATLLQIKSRLLLPKLPAETDGEEDEQDPRQVLIEMLLEYRKIKGQAAALTEMKAVADKQIAHAPIYTRALVISPLIHFGICCWLWRRSGKRGRGRWLTSSPRPIPWRSRCGILWKGCVLHPEECC